VKPRLYLARVGHGRAERVHHGFGYAHPTWLVDVDDVPVLPRGLRWLARFDPRDHFGDPRRSIRENVDAFLAVQGVHRPAGPVVMLATPRSLGGACNPLSVFWCHDEHGRPAWVIAEVHNTYGERHCYLLHPDPQGRAEAGKDFYVSPFFAVDGRYELEVTDPTSSDALHVAIALVRDGRVAFRATLDGAADPRHPSFLRGALRHPATGWSVAARIRWQGIRLWLKRLPVVPRPPAPVQGGVTS
jgi:DUF1365 family protein